MDPDKNDLNWTSYDKSSRYHHERTAYPPPPPPQYPPYDRYEEYGRGDRLLPPPQPAEISPRSYPESDYYQRAQVQRPYYDARSADAASAYRTEQRFYEEERERTTERAERERAVREQRELEERSRRETQTGVKNGKNGHASAYQTSAYQASAYQRGGSGGFAASRGGRRGGKPDRQYHRITCCCFRFYWPPWGYEPVEPIQPWYPRPSSRPASPSPPPLDKQPR